MKLGLEQIRIDGGTQPRAEISTAVVEEYAADMGSGSKFPPVDVYHDGTDYWLADGFHRYQAARLAKLENIEAAIHKGTKRDAVLFACQANADHGMRRTNADKGRAVETMLGDVEWGKWSNREIARRCMVSEHMIREMRESLRLGRSEDPTYTDKHGNVSTMNTENIGRQVEPLLSLPPLGAVPELPADPTADSQPTFNRTNENISWARWSWNPVTGCKHGCKYCYARDIANRFYPEKFEPTLREKRLTAPQNTAVPMDKDPAERCVFACSMADLFGEWVPDEWIDKVLAAVEAAPHWHFLFLTKAPARLTEFAWPENAWVGVTVDTQARVRPALDALGAIKASVRFISCEPMLEVITIPEGCWDAIDWLIIGARSKSSGAPEMQPDIDWVLGLTTEAVAHGCQVYHKPNLQVFKRHPVAAVGCPPSMFHVEHRGKIH